jgi:hypothetical protein
MRYLNNPYTSISWWLHMKKTRDIIAQIEEDLNEDIIDVIKSLNFENVVTTFFLERPSPIEC